MATQTQLNTIATKLAAIAAKREALAQQEAELKAEALGLLEDVGFTTVDCPKGKLQVRLTKSYSYTEPDEMKIKAAKAVVKTLEDDAKTRAETVTKTGVAFTVAKKVPA